jgi:uncharacterized protein (TIGR02300 family)
VYFAFDSGGAIVASGRLGAAAAGGPGPEPRRTEAKVVKAELGTKRVCPSCGSRYYDLHRDPILCPKCGAAYDPETLLKTRRARSQPVVEEAIEPVAEEEIETDIVAEEVEGDEEGEALPIEGAEAEAEEEEEVIEDASELGEDEDDMAEVIENVEEEDER